MCIAVKIIWDYHLVLDWSGPGKRQYAGIEDVQFLKVRLTNDERLLNVVHYWVLPAFAASQLLSAVSVCWIWKCSKR
jgi:hypothetical protein